MREPVNLTAYFEREDSTTIRRTDQAREVSYTSIQSWPCSGTDLSNTFPTTAESLSDCVTLHHLSQADNSVGSPYSCLLVTQMAGHVVTVQWRPSIRTPGVCLPIGTTRNTTHHGHPRTQTCKGIYKSRSASLPQTPYGCLLYSKVFLFLQATRQSTTT
ncbi:hypothetical protein TIFTF001_031094 [Ficus carica]|uniref:Uncharacterized protein n=1 Tax=Ficus carica TaxID=3494 RepID=A0AA88DUN7_FICCA|nr:hypothetical protein TIFTF001_031094 [Ficus carica]